MPAGHGLQLDGLADRIPELMLREEVARSRRD
jgi:hypothetical protein